MAERRRLEYLESLVRQFPDNEQIRRAYMEERVAVLAKEAEEANAVASESPLVAAGRLAAGTAATLAPWVASRAIKSAIPGGQIATAFDAIKVAAPFLLDAATGASAAINQAVRGQEVTGEGGAPLALGMAAISSIPHPAAQLLGLGPVAYDAYGRYKTAQQELQNIGADTSPLNTIAQATAGLPVPGIMTGGDPAAIGMVAEALHGGVKTVAESPQTTKALRKLFKEGGVVRDQVLPAVLGSKLGRAIFGEKAGKLDVEPAVYELWGLADEHIPGLAKNAPARKTELGPITREGGKRSPAMLEGDIIRIDRAYAKELFDRRMPIEITDPKTGAKSTVDPRKYSLGQWFKRIIGHEIGHLGGAEGEIGAEMVAEDVASGLRSIFAKKVPKPPTTVDEEVAALKRIQEKNAKPSAIESKRDKAFGKELAALIAEENKSKLIDTTSDDYNRAMSIYQHIKAGEGGEEGQRAFRAYPKDIREKVKADYEAARKAGKGPFFMETEADTVPGAEDEGQGGPFGSKVVSVLRSAAEPTESIYRRLVDHVEQLAKMYPDRKVEYVSHDKRGIPIEETRRYKTYKEIAEEAPQAFGQSIRMSAVVDRTMQRYDYGKAADVFRSLPDGHVLTTNGAEIIADFQKLGPEQAAAKWRLQPAEASAVQSLIKTQEAMYRIGKWSGAMDNVARRVGTYFKQVPKDLPFKLPEDPRMRKVIYDEVVSPSPERGALPKHVQDLIRKIEDWQQDMVLELHRLNPGKTERSDASKLMFIEDYVRQYLAKQIYRDPTDLNQSITELKKGFLMERGLRGGLGSFQEQDIRHLAKVQEGEWRKMAKTPIANYIIKNFLNADNKHREPLLASPIVKTAIEDLIQYSHGGAARNKNDHVGIVTDTLNRWFGLKLETPAEGHEALISHAYKMLVGMNPKFLLTMNPFDLLVRAAQTSDNANDVGVAIDVARRWLANSKLDKFGERFIRSGNEDIARSKEWRAGDKGILPEALQKILGKTGYEMVGKAFNALPNLVDKQEVINNRLIFLWNLERNMRKAGLVPSTGLGNTLGIEAIDKLTPSERSKLRPLIRKALTDTLESQGRLGALLGRSELASKLGFDRNSAANIAFMYTRMFYNYSLASVNNILRNMERIANDPDRSKLAMVQPIALLTVVSAGTMSLPQYVANVADGKKNPGLDALVRGALRELQLPTTQFVPRLMGSAGHGIVGAMTGEFSEVPTAIKNVLKPVLPITLYQQTKTLGKLFKRSSTQ